jgi:hypothetical protein
MALAGLAMDASGPLDVDAGGSEKKNVRRGINQRWKREKPTWASGAIVVREGVI